MAHLGDLGNQSVPDDVHDVLGTILRGSDGEKLGNVQDVIFDHDTMEIRSLVIDPTGWLKDARFLLPADRVSSDPDRADGLATQATRQQIENAPHHDQQSPESQEAWEKFEKKLTKYWEEDRGDAYQGIRPCPGSSGCGRSRASQIRRLLQARELWLRAHAPLSRQASPLPASLTPTRQSNIYVPGLYIPWIANFSSRSRQHAQG